MKKIILSSVSCDNEYLDERPHLLIVRMNKKLCKRIKLMSEAVNKLDCYSMTEFNYEAGWFKDACEDYNDMDYETIVALEKDWLENNVERVEVPELLVTKTEFKFIAVPKFQNDLVYTNLVPITWLDNNESLYIDSVY